MRAFLRTKTFRAAAIVTVLAGLYALAGFVVAPKLVRSALLKDIPEAIGATPEVGDIRINPFLLQATVDKFSLTAPGGEKLLGFDRLFIDFELSSILHWAYSFAAIDLTAPFVNAKVAEDGSLNLAQLRPKTPAKPSASSALPGIRIGTFKVSGGTVSYEDHSQADVFAARLDPVNFELRDFTTGPEGGKFNLTAATKLGERIEWHGHLSAQPIESDGEFRVDGLRARTLWEYLEDELNFVVNSGAIDLAATYKYSATGGPASIQVDLSKVTLSDLTVRPKNSDTDWITIPALSVTGVTADLAARRAHVDVVSITGIKLLTWLEPDGSLNLMSLMQPPAQAKPPAVTASSARTTPPPPPAATASSATTAPPAPPAATAPSATTAPPATAPAPAGAAPWQFDLPRFEVHDAAISAEDRGVRPAVKAVFAPLDLQVKGLSQDLSKPVAVTLETRINEKGVLAIKGDVAPQPAIADLSMRLSGLPLAALQPYIAQHSAMTLVDGRLGAEAKLHYGTQKSTSSLQFSGDISIENLHTVDDALHDDFVNWDRVDILGLRYSKGPDRLDIERILARKPYARVIIESDESMNIKRVLTAPGAAPAAPTAAAPAPPAAAASKTPRSAKSRPPAAAPAPASESMPILVKKVVIESGQANFTDLSVKPNFSAGIQSLGGTITGISSKAESRAKVDLHGSVGQYSPVTVAGEFNVLGPKLYTDIAMTFRNMELTIFNPYSGKFAGYNISKGKLTTELHYKVDGRKLDAQHHIVIDQLEFGDKTESKDAVSLPVKLAVSLLKDRNGVIDLNLPVTGSLDDPSFRLAPIIWKVFVGLLEKAVTAPFALLGSLFGHGPDIQFIDFEPGAGTLDPAAVDKAKTVAKALIERPQLKIEVPIAVVPDLDRPALVAARFGAEVGAEQSVKGGAKKGAAPAAPPSYDELDSPAKLELLTRLYTKDFAAEPKFPESVTGIKSKPDMVSAKIDFLEKAIREHIQVGDGELQTLGQDRAKALQQVLLADNQVGADRVFLVGNDKATPKDGLVRLELTLK
ncbi:MAG TPA: DUF748 domain-containing protein [Steroidobacteraceae bacterium]|nr:DUF748 domain-containing protein [Steroidobacteraceae bacterium]